MKLSQIFGKEIESPVGKCGYVLRVNAVEGRITCLTCVDDNEEEFNVPINKVKSIGETISYDCCCGAGEEIGKSLMLGKPVLDSEGNYIGRLTDISAEKNVVTFMYAGKIKFRADDVFYGDAVIVKSSVRVLKSNVVKDDKIVFRRGTPVTDELCKRAQSIGEYVQTNLRAIL